MPKGVKSLQKVKNLKGVKKTVKAIKMTVLQRIKIKLHNIYKAIVWYIFSWRMVVFLWVLFIGICLCYLCLYFSGPRIQALITFPGRDVNLKEITNHPAGLLVAEKVAYEGVSGNTITGLYIDNDSEKVVYYFHGNGAPLEYFYSDIQFISDLWYSVIAVEYPGYGDSTWIPYIDQNREASQVFYNKMQEILGFSDDDLIIWWYSIGTALAIDFANDREFDSLILFSPLSSRYDMARKTFWFPLQKLFFLKDSYVSKEVIKYISEPTLIIHGNTDKVVPFQQGELVYKNSGAKSKKFIEIDGFGHSLIPERYGDVLSWYIKDFLWKEEQPENNSEIFLDKDLAVEILKKYQQQLKIESLDLVTDESYTKYVDPSISFTKPGYIPEDMRRLDRTHIVDIKWNAQLRDEAATNFEALADAFYQEFWEKVVVVSSYRSYAYQAGIKARWCPDNLCAKAGHSEHQSGLWIDVWSASTKSYWDSSSRLTEFYSWLIKNAHLYGFHNTYQNGVDIDGYDIEPWHWRYLWIDLAYYLLEQDMTFAEFYYSR